MQHMSRLAENRLTKPWEECVLYPYDDKVPKRRDPVTGKLAYPEWKGGEIIGTITQGWGHTDAAGLPKIVAGQHWTQSYADQVFDDDIAPCCATVDRLVKVPLGQHQADTLDDFVFNAGAGTLQKSTLLKKLNAGDYNAVPAELMKFTLSRGEHMEGLVHRRRAEIAMWKMPDAASAETKAATPISPADHGTSEEDVICPKGELPASRSPADSKSVAAGGTLVSIGLAAASKGADQLSQATAPIKQVQGNLQDLGLWDALVAFVSQPQHLMLAGGVAVLALGAFVAIDRWRHLHQEAH